jgi:AraC-like DNA-binding protein
MPRIANKHDLPESYEHWELTLPDFPPRSALYQIRPIGIGTAETECLTSFLARLAEAHHLALGDLILRYFLPIMFTERAEADRPLNSFGLTKMSYVNGVSALATEMVSLTERLTLLPGIASTSLVRWKEFMSRHELFRHYRAWCVDCYSEQAAKGDTLYDLLLWVVLPVKVCSKHRLPLSENCPNCQKRIQPSLKHYRPGSCPHCRTFLGAKKSEVTTVAIDDLDYEFWVADNIGSLIAASPLLPVTTARQNVTAAINHCCNLMVEGNSNMLARLLKVAETTSRLWVTGRGFPSLKILSALSYLTEIPLIKFLTEPEYVLERISKYPVEIEPHQILGCNLHRANRIARQKVRQHLEAALDETPPPSLMEVAQRLGYRHPATLQIRFSELSKKICARYWRSERYLCDRPPRPIETQNYPDMESQRTTIEQELAQPNPASIRALTHKLGYVSSYNLKRKFPDLCLAILEKRREYQQKKLAERLRNCRQVLQAAMIEEPPPMLASVARRLKEIDERFLREHFAEEWRSIFMRYTEYQKKQMKDAEDRLLQSLQENPPRPLNQISKEIGYTSPTIVHHYPEISRSIMDRYENYARNLVAEKIKARLINAAIRPLEA